MMNQNQEYQFFTASTVSGDVITVETNEIELMVEEVVSPELFY